MLSEPVEVLEGIFEMREIGRLCHSQHRREEGQERGSGNGGWLDWGEGGGGGG